MLASSAAAAVSHALRLWVRRYQQQGQDGLADRSSRPTNSPATKVFDQQEQWILALRWRRLGMRRIQSELLREHNSKLSLATIHKVLKWHAQQPPKRSRLSRKKKHRYERPVPGDSIQMDNCKIARNSTITGMSERLLYLLLPITF